MPRLGAVLPSVTAPPYINLSVIGRSIVLSAYHSIIAPIIPAFCIGRYQRHHIRASVCCQSPRRHTYICLSEHIYITNTARRPDPSPSLALPPLVTLGEGKAGEERGAKDLTGSPEDVIPATL